jgi:hypothetical protein
VGAFPGFLICFLLISERLILIPRSLIKCVVRFIMVWVSAVVFIKIIDQDFLSAKSANLQPFIVLFEAEDRNIQIVFHRRGRALLPQLRAELNDLRLHSYKVMVPGRNYLAKRVYATVNAPRSYFIRTNASLVSNPNLLSQRSRFMLRTARFALEISPQMPAFSSYDSDQYTYCHPKRCGT